MNKNKRSVIIIIKIDLEEIKYNVQRSICNSKLADLYYNIKNGTSNIIKYFPIIWQDRNWDDHYFHKLMRFKLIRMENMIRNYGIAESSEEDADNIRYAINILDRITGANGFDYTEEALKPFYEKYPNYKFKFEFERCKDNPRSFKMINNDTEEQSKLKSECYDNQHKMEEADLDELYSFLRNHIKKWWD